MLKNDEKCYLKEIAWLEKQGENTTTLPKWKYKKDNAPLLRDSIILNKYGCVAKSPSGALVSDVWVIDYDELAKLPKEKFEKQGWQKPYGQRQECADCQFNYARECKGSCAMKRSEQNPAENIKLSAFKDKLLELFQRFGWYCKDKTQTDEDIIEYVDAHIQELIDIIQKSADNVEPKFKVGDYIERKDGLGCHAKIIFVGGNVYTCEKLIYSEDSSPFFDLMFKNQDEFQISSDFKQNLADDKVEPKFHEGEWITNGDYTWKIVEVKPLDYILQSQDGNIVDDTISYVDEQFHSFTIADAKDGDVLACENGWTCIFNCLHDNLFDSHCFMDAEGWFCEDGAQAHTLDNRICGEIHPATKEQRDLLFQKMKEASYEWDAEKKELKKIEHAWSEEDEHRVKDTIYFLDTAKKHYASTVEIDACIAWLKSLKERIGG